MEISITLNGNPHSIEQALSVAALLETLGLQGKPVVVELNQAAVFPRDYATLVVENGARVEIVALAAGG